MPFPNPETQFKAGGPPGPGRPKVKRVLTAYLAEALEADNGREAKAIMDALMKGAKRGRIAHIKEVLDRIEGKVVQPIAAGIEAVDLTWPDDRRDDDTDDEAEGHDAPPPSGADGGPAESGSIQGPGLREALGQDTPGGGPLPGDGAPG